MANSKDDKRRAARPLSEVDPVPKEQPSEPRARNDDDKGLLDSLHRLGEDVLAEPVPERLLDALHKKPKKPR